MKKIFNQHFMYFSILLIFLFYQFSFIENNIDKKVSVYQDQWSGPEYKVVKIENLGVFSQKNISNDIDDDSKYIEIHIKGNIYFGGRIDIKSSYSIDGYDIFSENLSAGKLETHYKKLINTDKKYLYIEYTPDNKETTGELEIRYRYL